MFVWFVFFIRKNVVNLHHCSTKIRNIMKKSLSIIIAAVFVFIASSCNKNSGKDSVADTFFEEPESDVVNVDIESYVFDSNDKDARVKVHSYIEVPKADNDVLKDIRKSVLEFLGRGGNTPREVFDSHVKSAEEELALSPEDLTDDEEWNASLYSEVYDSISANLVCQYFIQYSNYGYFYAAGAAHGIYGTGYYIFDLSTGKKLTETDVFSDISKVERLLKTEGLQNYLKEEGISENETDISKSEIKPNGNFGVTRTHLVYQYAPYEIACYATGAPALRVAKESVKPYMKKNTAIYKYWFGEE